MLLFLSSLQTVKNRFNLQNLKWLLSELKMTHEPFHMRIYFSFPPRPFSTLPPPPLLYTPLPHLTHYSIAYVKRVIAQIIQRQLSVCDTGEHNHHHKQPLMALSGSSKIAPQLGLAQCRAAGPNAVGTTVLQPGPNFTLMNLDLARLLQKAAMAIQYPPRWSKATPVATVHAREPSAMWKWREGGGGRGCFCLWHPSAQLKRSFLHTHTHRHTEGPTSKRRHARVHNQQHTHASHTHRQQGDIVHKLSCWCTHTHTSKHCHASCNGAWRKWQDILLFPVFKFGENVLFFFFAFFAAINILIFFPF